MSNRNFVEVIDKMLPYIPENDELKPRLQKLADKYLYMAPEIAPRIWGVAQDEIMKRFEKTSAVDLPDWALTALKIWSNKE
jgi:hypothetical protein